MLIALLLALAQGQVSPANATMQVTPTGQSSSAGNAGGPFDPSAITFVVKNVGIETMAWTLTANQNWITLSSASGNLGTNRSKQITATIDADADALATGNYAATLTFTNATNGIGNTTRQINLSVSVAPTFLVPGTEWGGATSEPGQIETGTAKCIAKWDVVPYQTLREADAATFTVGVVAFHREGIDRVEMAAEGGSFVAVSQMTLNPITNVWEYCATLELADFTADEVIELRAIAYPEADGAAIGGYPRLLDSLILYVDADAAQTPPQKYCSDRLGNDTTGDGTIGNPYKTPWKAAQAVATAGLGEAGGGTVWMDEGTYDWAGRPGGGSVPTTTDQYLTFRPWPTAANEYVRITTGDFPDNGIKKIHLYDITLVDTIYGLNNGDALWLDHSRCRGPGRTVDLGWWTHNFTEKYWTDVESTDAHQSVAPGGWMRDVHCYRNTGGPQGPKFCVNSTWDDVASVPGGAHGDFFFWHIGPDTYDNNIIYGVKATNLDCSIWQMTGDNRHFTNIAAVNVIMQGQNIGFIRAVELEHLLLWNITYTSFWEWQMPQSVGNNVSIKGCVFNSMGLNPAYGASVNDAWFDNNHYSFANITPGTNATVGDPMFGPGLAPLPGSPLLDRLNPLLVPIDVNGAVRSTPGTVGAVE